MPWVKLDDRFPNNEKVMLAGRDGRALYVTALCHSASQLTDGFIRSAILPMLAALSEIDDVAASAERLVEVGLWERVDGGYIIHDYHDYNPTAESVRKQREDNARRQAEWRARSGRGDDGQFDELHDERDTSGTSNGVSHGVTKSVSHTVPVPVPHLVVDDWDVDCARARLAELDVDPLVAERLLAEHPAGHIIGWVDDAERRKKLKSPAAWVVTRIRSGRAPPEQEDPVLGGDGKRYTRGKYAHLIQH